MYAYIYLFIFSGDIVCTDDVSHDIDYKFAVSAVSLSDKVATKCIAVTVL